MQQPDPDPPLTEQQATAIYELLLRAYEESPEFRALVDAKVERGVAA